MDIDTFINTVMTKEKSFVARENRALSERQHTAKVLCWEYNRLHPDDEARRREIIGDLFGSAEGPVFIQPSFHCDYGFNIHFHGFAFINYNAVILDTAPVHIGGGVLIAPNVCLACASHALDAAQRLDGVSPSAAITIEDEVWIGTGVTVCGGVTIGKGSVIGAGSVVNRDIPAGVVACGVPCRVLRPLTEADKIDPGEIIVLDGADWSD
ncbi:MAG: sugar O-acetyltransferase [Peptococcaceae bacterium]|nr:sugar O-acetyltransferase [Peptococcaceae bacterium]